MEVLIHLIQKGSISRATKAVKNMIDDLQKRNKLIKLRTNVRQGGTQLKNIYLMIWPVIVRMTKSQKPQRFVSLDHIYMRPEMNSNRFEMSFCLHGNLHGDFTAATFQTIARLYCTYTNDIF